MLQIVGKNAFAPCALSSINKFFIRFDQCLSIIKMSRDPTCDVNMHILENPRWRTSREFQLKYLLSEARYEKSVKGVVSCLRSSFKRVKNIFSFHYL